MTPKQFYHGTSKEQLARVCSEAKTTVANFKQIALAGGSCGKGLAERLAKASGYGMTEMEILYPERYEQSSSVPDALKCAS
ncbi:hypothetical protein [Spongiibacter tropicus]|uniref:hypothetical protein n=1 Tax=Spongiibacter tropicus TaxID=454602 RepID=UPI0003B53632|nr:hypothetical protein [Spongiibacter tropicus]